MRIGAKKRPFYRVVVVDERVKRNGAYLELLGTYNPLTEPKDIQLKKDRIDHWLKQGAVKSDGFLRIIGEAPQRPPRKPKKEKKVEEPAALVAETPAETPVETAAPEEATPETETPAPETQPETTGSVTSVVPRESEESLADASQNESGDSSATPQNDKVEEKETKNEGSA